MAKRLHTSEFLSSPQIELARKQWAWESMDQLMESGLERLENPSSSILYLIGATLPTCHFGWLLPMPGDAQFVSSSPGRCLTDYGPLRHAHHLPTLVR